MIEIDKKFKNWLVNILRRASYRWPARNEALKRNWVSRGQYRCEMCKNVFHRKEIQLHHVVSVVDPKIGFIDWNQFISRLFVPPEGFAAICIGCHDNITMLEDSQRKKNKKKLLTKPKKVGKVKG